MYTDKQAEPSFVSIGLALTYADIKRLTPVIA